MNYQPIFELNTSRLMGFEALARWTHPEQGVISPDRFIRVAEETGQIIALGQWVPRPRAASSVSERPLPERPQAHRM